MILDELFKFPIVMTDRDNEESKKSIYGGTGNEPSLDIVIGEAEYPYYNFIGLCDKWMPDEKSFSKALDSKKFNACLVTVLNIGAFLCPWTKEKFKENFKKFVSELKPQIQATERIEVVKLTREDIQKMLDKYDEDKKE